MSTNPPRWNHQTLGLNKGLELGHLGIFFDVGTGKTLTAIDLIRHLSARNNGLLRGLILCPKIVVTNWQREIAKYSKIHPRDVVPLVGSAKQRFKLFTENAGRDGVLTVPRLFITNYEAMEMEDLVEVIFRWNPELIVADEAHRLKSQESKRAKTVLRLSQCARYKFALTGTPILNTAMDLFNIFKFLDGGETFGKNFYAFRSIWFENLNANWQSQKSFPKWEARPDTYGKFSEMVKRKSIQAKKSECLDLPPFVRKQVFVELSKEQRRLYDQMKKDYIAYVEEQEAKGTVRAVVAQLAITKALRLQQIVTGYAKIDDGSIHKIKDNPRLKALEELLEELSPHHKIIVWSVFHENYSDIATVCRKLKLEFGELHGKIGDKERQVAIDRFTNDESCRVLIANQAAGGIGINLIASDVSIFFSKNFSLEQDIQAEGRNYRGGSERHQSVTRIDITAEGTIDDLINTALAEKQEISSLILDWKDTL